MSTIKKMFESYAPVQKWNAEDIKESSSKMDVPTKHQFAIAKKTLRMPDAIVGVMGGMNKDEARKFLKEKMKWTDKQIAKLEESK